MKFALIMFFACALAATALADTISLNPVETTVTTPGAIKLELDLTNAQAVYGIEFTITDTPERAAYSSVQTTGRTTGALTTSSVSGNNQVRIATILSGTGNGIQAGNGAILTITYYAASVNGEVDFNLQNVRLYGKNGNLLTVPSATGTTVTLQAQSTSSSAASGAGGSGSGGSGSSSGGGSASSSTSTQTPFVNFPVQSSKPEPAPQPKPEIIETEAQPIDPSADTPAPSAPKQEGNVFLWIVAGIVVIITTAGLGYYKLHYKKLDDEDLPDPEPNPAPTSVIPPQEANSKTQQIIEQKLK